VVVVLVEFGVVQSQIDRFTVDLDAGVPVAYKLLEQVLERALLVADDRRGDFARVPSGSSRIWFTMSCADCSPTSSPVTGSYWVPIRAYSSRR